MSKSNFAEREEGLLKYWEEQNVFQKTLQKKSPKGNFIFFEGPPTANGRPGLHHVLARVFKDVIPRFKTMCGYHVERKAGWDTHGLPVELQVEKELKISGKPDIEKYGIEQFNQKCKESVWKYKKEWEEITRRIGFWLDLEHPYITYNNEYMETLWWILKQADAKGLLYKDFKVVPQCPSCGTALSSHEVAQGYKTVKENSVYLKFKVVGEDNTYILSWTTTPWTLPGNVALAVGEKIDYVKVKQGENSYFLAKALLSKVLDGEYELLEEMSGKELAAKGLKYEPLFPGAIPNDTKNFDKAYQIYLADFVSTADGTGVVHTAVMYGEDDFNLGEKVGLPKFHTVSEFGKFNSSVKSWAGQFVKDPKVEKEIVADLKARGLLLKEMLYEHEYPFCWRCDSPLIYYAKDSWFIKMTAVKKELLANNAKINWVPDYIKDGRFGEWLMNVKDWAISRERYWGAPLPVWICDKCKKIDVMGSFEELKNKAGRLSENRQGELDVHKPFVDELTYDCACGGKMKRTPEVFDCWYESGSMPFAQHHYPFENKKMIDKGEQFPAEYISEGMDQTRGWFYTLLAISTFLGKGVPYQNVICLGLIRDKFGKKMSKSRGNIVVPAEMMDKYGVDALRMMFYSMNQPGDFKNFDEETLKETLRKTVMVIDNVANFYKLYAADASGVELKKFTHPLDQWILTRLNFLVKELTLDMEQYHVFEASRRLMDFLNDLTTWYVRRSRERFKSQDLKEKQSALATLKKVLENLAIISAPFMPFVSEHLWQNLGGTESVHLQTWPEAQKKFLDAQILSKMTAVRKIVELGLAERDKAQVKVRQPLAELKYKGIKLSSALENIVAEELNVKKVSFVKDLTSEVTLDLTLTEELKQEGLLRELVRQINSLRREKGLTIADRVKLVYQTDGAELKKLFANLHLTEQLKKATLLSEIARGCGEKEFILNGEKMLLSLK